MAGRKGTTSNEAFMKQFQKKTVAEVQNVSKTLSGLDPAIKDAGKKAISNIDLANMDSAPDEWNRYPLLSDSQMEKYLELKMSIYTNGVETPLLLWKQKGRYMILSGHNRKSICQELLQEHADDPGFDDRKFRFLPCIVYDEEELTEIQARMIINNANLYRDFSKLPPKTKILITKDRMELYKHEYRAKGERVDRIMEDLGMERTSVYENLGIYEKVLPEIQELYYSGKLTRKAILRFWFFGMDTQQWIYDNYSSQLVESKVKKLKKHMSRADIAELFESKDEVPMKRVTYSVPADRADEFREVYERWLKGELTIKEN